MDRFFKDKNGEIVVTEKPNAPLLVALGAWLLSYATSGDLAFVFTFIFNIMLFYWAILEIIDGVNQWRKFLGIIVVLVVLRNVYGIFF